jgi:S-DNA-T family DNA segregation ATPase FtsK/SpoIIIE
MSAQEIQDLAPLILGGGVVAAVVWLLHKIGTALKNLWEAIATVLVVGLVIWFVAKMTARFIRWSVVHWRTTLTAAGVGAWCYYLGWPSLAITAGALVVGLLVWLVVDRETFDPWAGRYLRSWWMRWVIYARKLPTWLHNCGLTIRDDESISLNVSPVRARILRTNSEPDVHRPRVLKVKSGPSWDEVHVKLVPGQTPEDFDAAARALASARNVQRVQVRELKPNVVSIDFQRRDTLAAAVSCTDLRELDTVSAAEINLRKVYAGRTEYGTDWTVSLAGGHTLVAGATGAGKGSALWSPLVSIAPAIRDGLVRVSGIDPKGMELAYGRGIFQGGYAVTGKEAVALLDELVARMDARKVEFAGHVRTVPISTDYPLEVLEFDELGALTKYTDRKTREQITERVALLTTQGRALGFTVRGYVQEPTKDTVPVRDLFPRRLCLRVSTKSHVAMVLGDNAYERGAWANRIGEREAGVGYLFGEGIREPLRVRAGWVDDPTVKQLEAFVTGRVDGDPATVVQLPAQRDRSAGVVA